MPVVIVLLSILCAALLLRVYVLEKGLREGAGQLKERREQGSGAPIRMAAPNKAMEALLDQVNQLLKLRQAEQTAYYQREKALRRQIANVSHDLRTPLTSILGYLQLLEAGGLTEEEKTSYFNVIEGRARVLQDLITSFYDLSRLEAGEYPITREKVDLKEVIAELLASFYEELESKFTMTVDLPDGLPDVWGDRAALSRVYANLIRNALDHGSGGLSVSLRRTETRVESRFTNGGADLREEDLPHVFDRFFTSDQTRSGRNTGLGLAIVRTLAGQMGGSVRAELVGREFSLILGWKC